MATHRSKPLVLVPACNRAVGRHPFHIAGKKYTDAVRLAGCLPLVVPDAEPNDLDDLLDAADGLLLTGSPSNVHPSHFDEAVRDPSLPLDPVRDAWTLPLIPKALERGLPFFAICRGAQETNVALGGSLHQAVHEIDGHLDHRDPDDEPLDVQYAPAHSVDVLPGGLLARLLQRDRIQVNSLHGQAVNRLAPGLRVEARAPDGVIEAFSKPDAPGFNLAVQWHPEWQAASNPVSMAMLSAFGSACAMHRDQRNR
ncbi:MAG TPA: gamma-glutamyl-gamma-aminobutyrate hydrolase family protein [Burkholderiaceae bacterium]|jgi:putative glutamine amidotransferase|nr:gamma-glutamyl-gamma-aminobutyrate hydrolase family protein [Burkholderiaceae bacterium]